MMSIGIDPGLATLGFAVCSGSQKSPKAIDYGVFSTLPLAKELEHMRIQELATDLIKTLKKYRPSIAVVEDIFYFKNAKTVISIAQVRGMVLFILNKYGLQIKSKTPLQVKQTLCGYGKATKKQVQNTITRLYSLSETPQPDDVADALALAWFGLKKS